MNEFQEVAIRKRNIWWIKPHWIHTPNNNYRQNGQNAYLRNNYWDENKLFKWGKMMGKRQPKII